MGIAYFFLCMELTSNIKCICSKVFDPHFSLFPSGLVFFNSKGRKKEWSKRKKKMKLKKKSSRKIN